MQLRSPKRRSAFSPADQKIQNVQLISRQQHGNNAHAPLFALLSSTEEATPYVFEVTATTKPSLSSSVGSVSEPSHVAITAARWVSSFPMAKTASDTSWIFVFSVTLTSNCRQANSESNCPHEKRPTYHGHTAPPQCQTLTSPSMIKHKTSLCVVKSCGTNFGLPPPTNLPRV